MKRIVFWIMLAALCCNLPSGFAAEGSASGFAGRALEKPSCVLMKFTNETRYESLDAGDVLADLVLEKLIASRHFRLTEMQGIDGDAEKMLYDKDAKAEEEIRNARESGNLNAIFEGSGFGNSNAASISQARKGQIVSPEITSAIGRQHGVDYLIHGAVLGIGAGKKESLFRLFGNDSAKISVLGELRVIRASTGEIVWSRQEAGSGSQDSAVVLGAAFGSAKLNSNSYSRAMNEVAQKLVDALVADMDAYKIILT